MRRMGRTLMMAAVVALGLPGAASAALTTFASPAAFAPGATFIGFDGGGVAPGAAFRSLGGVGFALLTQGTLTDTGFGPSIAGGPNSTIPRAFAPTDGILFLNTINSNGPFFADLRITLPGLFGAIAFELSGGGGLGVPDTLSFEVYRGATPLGTLSGGTASLRSFAFHGIASDTAFDTLVIRQTPDSRFLLENLRFGSLQPAVAVPGPGALPVLAVAILGLGLARRRRPCALDRRPARA